MSPMPHTTATILWTSLSEGYYSLLVWFMFLLASFMGWWVDEKTKRSVGLRLWLIIQARVTAVSVIKPVSMILVLSSLKDWENSLVEVVIQWGCALCLLCCGVSHRACQGPLKYIHIRHKEDVEALVVASPQKPLWPWSVVWGHTAG